MGRARVTDIHVLAARKVVYEQDRTSRRRGLIRGVSSWRRAKPVGSLRCERSVGTLGSVFRRTAPHDLRELRRQRGV
ncbi:MAG TPA: hypothetical protein VKH82_16875, partial [Candidatus Binatia bacterium]|nr:hypothetical protein [Candidatus Binatia bacterium]